VSRRKHWFDANVKKALADDALRAAIADTTVKKMASRAAAIAQVDQFQALRDLAARIKQHTIDHLDGYLDEFVRRFEAAGGRVHFAATAADANECIVRIARDNGLTLCAKAKSMTTEETHLNEALEAAGVRAVETDLGEFVVQLDHDRPSHIVTPIIHKNRATVARAFVRELGAEYTEDPEALTQIARRYLRDVFRRCDMGVTGVNFAIAETGTLCVCTNEGNGRLTMTRPRVHVALMGIEKVIPRMADLAVFTKLLSRSGTGQPITVYASLIQGPRRADDPDGPEQLHVVILDGGRRAIQAGPYSQVLRCIRCGACLNACPVYRQIGGHAYGSVYPGPIGKLLSPLLNDLEYFADLPQASSLCGLCLEVCPVNINIPDVLVHLRRDQVKNATVPWSRRAAFRGALAALSSPWLYRIAQKAARWFSALPAKGEWITRLPGPMGRLTEYRDLPRPAAKPFRELWPLEKASRDSAASQVPMHVPHPDPASGAAEQRELPPLDPAVIRRVATDADLVSIFCARAEAIGFRVTRSSPDALGSDIAALVGRKKVIIEPSLSCRPDVERALAGQAEWLDPQAGDAAMFATDVGITGVRAAVAETGTIVWSSGPDLWRGLSLIPPMHIAIVRREQIVPDLLDLFSDLPKTELSANTTLITGPSKTGDIEGILITGVHGPGEVHVIVL